MKLLSIAAIAAITISLGISALSVRMLSKTSEENRALKAEMKQKDETYKAIVSRQKEQIELQEKFIQDRETRLAYQTESIRLLWEKLRVAEARRR